MLILVALGSQTTLRAPDMCTDPYSSLLEHCHSYVLRPAVFGFVFTFTHIHIDIRMLLKMEISKSNGNVLTYKGCNYFRQRLILSILSGKALIIKNIRDKDDNPGLRGMF